MNKFNTLAGFSCAAGFVIFLFGSISSFTGRESNLLGLDLFSILGPEKSESVNNIGIGIIKTAAAALCDLPVYLLLISAGIIIFILNGIFRKN